MEQFARIVGARQVLTAPEQMARHLADITGHVRGQAAAVVCPGSPEEVARTLRLANELGMRITVQSGNTSICGGSVPVHPDEIVLSLHRLNRIRAVDTGARTATVDAGVVIQTLQARVAEDGLDYPLMFGARGSAMIGGALATNAGGSNVLRHGNARELCLGIEAVLPDGRIIHALSGLVKDNRGYDLRNLMIGSEGTLGIITGAVVRLVPTPKVRVTAFLALDGIDSALTVLNRLQDASGGLVEAFEWMPGETVEAILGAIPGTQAPLEQIPRTGLLLELASTRDSDAAPTAEGESVLQALLMSVIGDLMEDGLILDGAFASSERQRQEMWHLREATLEMLMRLGPFVALDASLPLSHVPPFLARADAIARAAGLRVLPIGHLGDGNIHYSLLAQRPQDWDPELIRQVSGRIYDVLDDLGGSFSAEHGIGRHKAAVLASRKEAAQYEAMRAIKSALDPGGCLGSGIFFPAS
ncbi:FAD-binding oxidoreductase [Pseudooceanicola sp. CBS1P-1]|uniref:FAD-binding protein n=1 Tax=Pseudooceanicola albus TaxID=2692189 RepID=A0A6L7G3S1_9RHOB|nr:MULTISPECIES: FAD-binding oxidoreductase [Pseudooceanicola]MBT9385386.1 FAD-binding oxidoreductase [Pseudooceanicola endophyticus]MXN18755.1 FAD-binding protein [Pseudooceanicola albus]